MRDPRRCPECRGPLASRRQGEVELDACPACGGIWFDATELSHGAAMSASLSGWEVGIELLTLMLEVL